ncbi:MAG: SEC-C domain-containing protein [Peptostreptococcaceae bacterium]|nr:SEC-C domain-containing protein [Peptostreptococcaceae bacterium]
MTLLKQWQKLLDNLTEESYEEFFKEYSEAETRIYKDILSNHATTLKGTFTELAEKFQVRPVIFIAFVDGINTSLENEYELDSIELDTELSFNIDFHKLFFNMLKADADYLYSLEEWKGIFTEEEEIEIAKEFKRSRTVKRDTPKIKRNDSCPCGSGKKYKNCCGKN